MAPLEETPDGVLFKGTVDRDDHLVEAAKLAASCRSFRPDDDDEDPVADGASCFGCRYRRWVPGGFTCVRESLPTPG